MIEKLKYEDLNLYKDLIDNCFGSSNDISIYQKYNENSSYTILVYKINNIIAGSITFYKIDLFTYSFQPAIEIFNVAVLDSYRGQNIATKIFNEVIQYAKDNNYGQIFLTCLADAYGAHKLYESLGFKKMNSVKYALNLK